MSPRFKTRAEQRLEHLTALKRPLTEEESDELRRSLHAVYVRNYRNKMLARHEQEETQLLAKMEAESRQPERYSHECRT